MKKFLLIALFSTLISYVQGQSIIGRWQLIKQSSCMEDEIDMEESGAEELVTDMKSRAGETPEVIVFKENNTGEESSRILSRKKTYNARSFLYKYNGENLYILDKKSRTIVEGFSVEKLDADSLIISNSARVCETKIFVRLK